MTKTIPAHKTLYAGEKLTRQGQYPPEAARAQRVLIGVDRHGQEYAVWLEMDSARGLGRRPVLFSPDLDTAIAAFNNEQQKMASQGYSEAAQQPELQSSMIAKH